MATFGWKADLNYSASDLTSASRHVEECRDIRCGIVVPLFYLSVRNGEGPAFRDVQREAGVQMGGQKDEDNSIDSLGQCSSVIGVFV